MAGVDAAGKTTKPCELKLEEIPTLDVNVETVEHTNLCLTVWDVRGQDKR